MDGQETVPVANKPHVVIAGGSGIEALRLLAHEFAGRKVPFVFHSGGDFTTEAVATQVVLEHIDTLNARWHGREAGPLDLYEIISALPKDALVYVYGPLAFIQAAVDAADCYGVPRRNLKLRRLDDGITKTDDRAFDVLLERSARTVHVAKDVTMLDALLAAGVEVRRGCHDGHCGQCAVEVLEGDVEHRDMALNDVDRTLFGCICPCVSRAKGTRLVIDL